MSIAVVYSRSILGVDAPQVIIEVHLAKGLPGVSLVGLPAAAVRESRDRVRSAINSSGFVFPRRQIVVNLAPADLPKHGGRFDLPIALGILAASGQIPANGLPLWEFAGELGLTGSLRPVSGLLATAIQTRTTGRQLLTDPAGASEAALAYPGHCFGAETLRGVVQHLTGRKLRPAASAAAPVRPALPDLNDVNGQLAGKRVLEIAAAGGHHVLLIGPPGTGKSLLARRLPGILPEMSGQETLEAAAVHSVWSDGAADRHWGTRPFRAPHHGTTASALVGGGARPRPGEISLAHNGVLFLDELSEFSRECLESLREPLETGTIQIARANWRLQFPARFQLIAAMNPCPCGHSGDPERDCRCNEGDLRRYRSRLSGPVLDRIALRSWVPRQRTSWRTEQTHQEDSATIRARVSRARTRREAESGACSASLEGPAFAQACALSRGDAVFLERAVGALELSGRGQHQILRVARTIADLAGCERISRQHLAEAISYRRLP